jgi:hypothetical protein
MFAVDGFEGMGEIEIIASGSTKGAGCITSAFEGRDIWSLPGGCNT